MAAAGALRAKRGSYGIRTFQWHSDFIDTYAGVLDSRLSSPIAARAAAAATRPLWSLVRAIAKRCEATLVASAWQVAKLAGHGVPRVVHRPFGIERDVFRPDARSFESRRALLALAGRDSRDDLSPAPTRILVGLGRFAIEKRWDIVLDAFVRLRASGRDAILVLFGDGPERDRMRARIDASPYGSDVVFTGFVKGRTALAESLASADAFVHGCPFETFGLSIAEAMSCGLPAVVPDEGGAAEMHDPAAGERYRAGDVDACTAALGRLLDRLDTSEATLRDAAVRAAARLPTVREHFEEQVALYRELLDRGAA